MKRTTHRGVFIGLAIALCFGFGASATEQGVSITDVLQKDGAARVGGADRAAGKVDRSVGRITLLRAEERAAPRPFKLNAAGGIDLATGVVVFGGVGTHLGLYVGNGFLDPSFNIFGSITAANGDMLNFMAGFVIGPAGDLEATFFFSGGTGRFVDAVGSASGPVTLEPDFTFVISVRGNLNY